MCVFFLGVLLDKVGFPLKRGALYDHRNEELLRKGFSFRDGSLILKQKLK